MYEFPGEGRKLGVHVPPRNPPRRAPLYIGKTQYSYFQQIQKEQYIGSKYLHTSDLLEINK